VFEHIHAFKGKSILECRS